ncbi:MAG: dihydrofolate reductase [Propionibacteriaceae bacterium]|jgi:dihydrofolate reductase|nr:dihydrofolate reductase [Propionibacteriaceae bacterium]
MGPAGPAAPGDGRRLTAIAAVAANGVIGDGRKLLWRLPADLARFQRLTTGGVLVMGRRTFDSLGGLLPGRVSIVLTRAAPAAVRAGLAAGGREADRATDVTASRAAGVEPSGTVGGGPGPRVGGGDAPGGGPAAGAVVFWDGGGQDGATGLIVVGSVAQALAALAGFPQRRWWSAGGGQVYRALWDHTTDLDLTEVHQRPAGAVRFPEVDPAEWRQTWRQPGPEFDFVTYSRRTPAARARLAAVSTG